MSHYERTEIEVSGQTVWKQGCPPEAKGRIEYVSIIDVVAGRRFGTYGPIIQEKTTDTDN